MPVYDPATNPLNNIEWAFPLTECFHVAAMALSIGTITVVDLRLLGIGMKRRTAAELVRDTELWTLSGMVIVIASGLLIFSSDPVHYLNNGPFQFKMAALLVAILYNYTIHRRVAQAGTSGLAGAAAGLLSILLWLSLVFAGIFIAFV
jgi:hypothetical protein